MATMSAGLRRSGKNMIPRVFSPILRQSADPAAVLIYNITIKAKQTLPGSITTGTSVFFNMIFNLFQILACIAKNFV